jgi:hypothetical protein
VGPARGKSRVEIMPANKPLCAMAMQFLTMDSDRVAYIDQWAWSVPMQMALVSV